MCGIFGFVGARARAESIDLGAAVKAMRHRGPDDRGTYFNVPPRNEEIACALAHTRLSIIDLSRAGRQPMSSADGRYTIVYNGEVYNFRELRSELEAGGCRFVSDADTEVVLHAYRVWGKRCVDRFRGMFAYAIWDAVEGTLSFARDRFGVKPFYYRHTAVNFAFASEVRTMLATGVADRRLSHRGLATFLMYGSVSDPWTILDDVFSLLPGHRGEFANGRLTIEPYWELPSQSRPSSFAEAVDRVGPLLRDAVQSELAADVPLGVFLSGGIDSSTIAGYASSASDIPVHTFTVTFDEEAYNEEKFAAQVAARFRCDHRQVHLSAGSALEELDRVFAAADQPSADGVNTYFVSKAAREAGLAVALSGLGGDELFAGYSNFRLFRSMLRSGLVASKFPKFLSRSMTGAAFNGRSIRSRKFAAILSAGGSPGRTYSVLRSMFTPEQVLELAPSLGDEVAEDLETCDIAGGDLTDDVSLHSRLELTRYLRNTLLRDTDTMSMAHSLEVRVPLLDHYLAEAVLPLPRNVKLSRDVNKPLMIAAGPQLPGDIVSRRKMGFILPLEAWLKAPNADRLRGVLEAPWSADDMIATDTLRHVWKLYEEGSPSVSFSRIWSLTALKDWCIRNHVSA
jgi:asparagine synthase (glutamine-hydrolysing)